MNQMRISEDALLIAQQEQEQARLRLRNFKEAVESTVRRFYRACQTDHPQKLQTPAENQFQ